MRPLPRLHAVTDAAVLALADFPVRAAAIAAAGSAVALHARDRAATATALLGVTTRLLALARPAEANVAVNARADIAVALETHGLQLGAGDLAPRDVRRTFPRWSGWIGASVHSLEEAQARQDEEADYLLVGNIFETRTHPGRPATGLGLIQQVAKLGLPVIAIGGMTPERVRAVRDAGAWGVAAIGALWHADDPAAAALGLLEPWAEAA